MSNYLTTDSNGNPHRADNPIFIKVVDSTDASLTKGDVDKIISLNHSEGFAINIASNVYSGWNARVLVSAVFATTDFTIETPSAGTTAFADDGTGQTTVTSADHGMNDGRRVVISGTTSYNGDFFITNVTKDTFDISATFVADDATGIYKNYIGGHVSVAGDPVSATDTTLITVVAGTAIVGDFVDLVFDGVSFIASGSVFALGAVTFTAP